MRPDPRVIEVLQLAAQRIETRRDVFTCLAIERAGVCLYGLHYLRLAISRQVRGAFHALLGREPLPSDFGASERSMSVVQHRQSHRALLLCMAATLYEHGECLQ